MTKNINLKEEQLSNLDPNEIKKALLEIKDANKKLKDIKAKHQELLNDTKEVLLLCDSIEGDGFNITMTIKDRKGYWTEPTKGIKTLKLNSI
jgi:hypothetical protein